MLQRRRIHNYRRFHGPQRGVQTVHRSLGEVCRAIRLRVHRLKSLNSRALLRTANDLRTNVQQQTPQADLQSKETVIESFALLTEAMRRATGMTYYDVQLHAGLVLTSRSIAEVQTGEGKTITTALPAYLFSLGGRGVHVATTNAYLSKRDADTVRPALALLGVSVGYTAPNSSSIEKRAAYECDITYGPGYEFGFDFLRDEIEKRNRPTDPLGWNLLQTLGGFDTTGSTALQRGHAALIVDEVDSVLIDEANMPLILSGPVLRPVDDREALADAASLVDQLQDDEDFHLSDGKLTWSENGWENIHASKSGTSTGRGNGSRSLQRPWSKYIENAVRAKHCLKRDVDYVVRSGKIEIVDQQTGRIHAERTWRAGLHQAVEVFENVELTSAKETQGRVTRQRYCRAYEQLCGLTGTASGSDRELNQAYEAAVVRIPTHRPCQRVVLPLRMFATRSAKHAAIVDDVEQRHQTGQPILIGTSSIDESTTVSRWLAAKGVEHRLLNGVQDESEADIVSKAGRFGSVTVATNMAGRGTDIPLCTDAKELGGLHVIASEFHESARINRQLAGRCARQGEPGSFQPFASLEDKIFVNGEKLAASIHRRCKTGKLSEANEYSVDVSREVASLQSQLQHRRVQERSQMAKKDRWIETVQSALARRA